MKKRRRRSPHKWGDTRIRPGEAVEVSLVVSESYSSLNIPIPVFVQRAEEKGPVVFVTAAIHGDEINGTGAIRSLICHNEINLTRGTLILVPVVNILGFDRHSRYLPDRRDLNRCFPGSLSGSLASRMARLLFREIVGRCDFGIDLHTAAVRRTNFPNIRADMDNPETARLAAAFGCEIILSGKGPDGSLRREATDAGCPTIVLEAGEVWKVEPRIIEFAVRGVASVLSELGMVDYEKRTPSDQLIIEKTRWVRSDRGGFLRFHVAPGDLVNKDDALATNTSLTGIEQNTLNAPFDAIVLGMTTLPSTSPGDPVCHLGLLEKHTDDLELLRRRLARNESHDELSEHLATNVTVVDQGDAEYPAETGTAEVSPESSQ